MSVSQQPSLLTLLLIGCYGLNVPPPKKKLYIEAPSSNAMTLVSAVFEK